VKMTMKYSKPVCFDPSNEYSKIVFYEDRVRLDKHAYDTTVSFDSLSFLREEGNVLRADPANKYESSLNLGKVEKDLRAWFQTEVVKNIYTEVSQRNKEENNIKVWRKDVNNEVSSKEPVIDKSVYDISAAAAISDGGLEADAAKDSTAVVEGQEDKIDFLARYLVDFPTGKPLDALQAEFVAKKCKNDFRKRLLDRAQIIQKRLEEEQENLKKKRSQMQRRGGGGNDQGDERQFEQYQSNAMFRIQILEQRLARHEMQAIKKFVDLEKQLAEDPRLAAMWQQTKK